MFDPGDFQRYLDQPPDYWRDFGRRVCASLSMMGKTLDPTEVDSFIASVLARMTAETGGRLSEDRAKAFAEGMRKVCTKGISSP